MILVDSNVIIDVLSEDAKWRAWPEAALIDAANRDELAVNPIILRRDRFGLRNDGGARRSSRRRGVPSAPSPL